MLRVDHGAALDAPEQLHVGVLVRAAAYHQFAHVGTGKTHIALGLAACQRGMSVGFTTAALVHELMEARDERRLLNLQRQLSRPGQSWNSPGLSGYVKSVPKPDRL